MAGLSDLLKQEARTIDVASRILIILVLHLTTPDNRLNFSHILSFSIVFEGGFKYYSHVTTAYIYLMVLMVSYHGRSLCFDSSFPRLCYCTSTSHSYSLLSLNYPSLSS